MPAWPARVPVARGNRRSVVNRACRHTGCVVRAWKIGNPLPAMHSLGSGRPTLEEFLPGLKSQDDPVHFPLPTTYLGSYQ